MGSFNPKGRIPLSVGVHFGQQWKCAESIFISPKVKLKCVFAGCIAMSVAVKSLRLHFHLRLAVAVPHGQTGAYAEHLVPLEECAAASRL